MPGRTKAPRHSQEAGRVDAPPSAQPDADSNADIEMEEDGEEEAVEPQRVRIVGKTRLPVFTHRSKHLRC